MVYCNRIVALLQSEFLNIAIKPVKTLNSAGVALYCNHDCNNCFWGIAIGLLVYCNRIDDLLQLKPSHAQTRHGCGGGFLGSFETRFLHLFMFNLLNQLREIVPPDCARAVRKLVREGELNGMNHCNA